jgi:hypothetical protein
VDIVNQGWIEDEHKETVLAKYGDKGGGQHPRIPRQGLDENP